MHLLSKVAFALFGIVLIALAMHSRFPEALRLHEEGEMVLLFISGVLATSGFLLAKGDPLPYFVNKIWFVVCVFSVVAVIDFSLRLGNIKGGMFTLWPLHVFTAYGSWLVATNRAAEQEHVRRLWVVGGVSFFLSPLFNYG